MNGTRTKLLLISACLGLICPLVTGQALGQSSKSNYVIIGYLPGRDWSKETVEAEKLTHINYAFATPSQSGGLNALKSKDAANLVWLRSLKQKNKNLKILISIGGWGGCRYFSDAALTDSSRRKFASSCASVLKQYKLDGIDIDWEYPAQIGANNIFRPEDKQNYTLLLKVLREKLDEEGEEDGLTATNHYLLTIATGVDSNFVSHTELGKAQQYLDYINIMTYDIYHGNDKVTGHHANLYPSAKGDHSRNSSDEGVKGHIAAGVPANKIVLGLPFYGRAWADVEDKDDGLYQPSTGKLFSPSYDELVDSYINTNGYVRHWDKEAKAPFLWNSQTRTFISYPDPEEFAVKMDYVKTNGLAGVMFWEYGHDLKHRTLVDTLYQGLRK
ncbi:MAG: chitinase [Pedosphaera sp.]|nr:chitinase [Pedosphaera sp.]